METIDYEKKIEALRRKAKGIVRAHNTFDYATIVKNSSSMLSYYYPLYGRSEILYAVLYAIEYEKSLSQEIRDKAITEQPYIIRRENEFWKEIATERDVKF